MTRGIVAAVEHVPEPVFVVADGRARPANPAARELLAPAFGEEAHLDLEGLLEEIDFRDPETGERIPLEETATMGALNGERSVREGLLRDPADGRIRKVVVSAGPVRRPDGSPAAVVVLRDVTEQWRAEQALERHHEEIALLARVADSANRATSSEEALQEVVDEVCRWIGWPVGHAYVVREDVLEPTAIVHVEDGLDVRRFFLQTAGTTMAFGEGFVGRVAAERRPLWDDDVSRDPEFLRRTASCALRSGFAAPVLVGDEVVAVLEFFSDRIIRPDREVLEVVQQVGVQIGRVIERERSAAALEEARDLCFRMLEDFPTLLGRTDAAGAMSWVNGTWLDFTGRAMADEVGEGWMDAVHAEDRPRCRAIVRRAVEERTSYEMEFRMRYRDGKYRAVLAVGRPFDRAGVFAGLLCGAFDISERRSLEQELRHAQRMEAVGRLAGGVAHDFNNVLTVLLSHAQLALEETREGDPVREDLQEMLEAARRGAALTRQLLAFSRKQPVEPTLLDPAEVVRSVEPMLRRLLEESVTLEVAALEGGPPVFMDRAQLEQVIMNLATNARDAMPDGGTLLVGTAQRAPREEERRRHADVAAGPWVILRVSDTGEGMTEPVRQRIFEPFYTTKPRGQGTGLGLSTVYGIVKQAGGDIDVWSRPGQGTTFEIVLPAAHDESGIERGPSTRPRPGYEGGATILVVEDQAEVRAVVRRILERAGFDVLTARDGGEALLICEQRTAPMDLVLTDLVMPEMSGWQLAEHVEALCPGTRFLFMTGYAEELLQGEITERARGRRVLDKPLMPKTLLDAVRSELGRERGRAIPRRPA
ncbi:MAG: ATP-binding protein [Myxococcota bacterium]